MAFTLKKSHGPSGPVGLDLDGGYLAAVQTDGNGVVRAVSADLAPGVLNEGEVEDVAGLSAALKDFFRRADLPKRVRLGIANQQVAVRQIELPLIEDEKDRVAAIRFQAAEAIAMPLEEAVLDYQVIGDTTSPEDGSTRLQVVVVAAREAMISRVLEAVRGAGLKPEGIDLGAFALVRMLAPPPETGVGAARVYCHLGGVTNLAIAVGRSCLFTRPLSAGVEEDAEHTAAALAEEIRLSIDYYLGQPEAPRVGDVLLSGPGSRVPGLAEELASLIDLPVEMAEPLGGLSSEGISDDEDPTRHTVAAGLALGASA